MTIFHDLLPLRLGCFLLFELLCVPQLLLCTLKETGTPHRPGAEDAIMVVQKSAEAGLALRAPSPVLPQCSRRRQKWYPFGRLLPASMWKRMTISGWGARMLIVVSS
ncbi:hypothetical protein IWZ00DRAFT_501695 [Phyllosticta capitalensis]|uniref:Secreted protein n=1 Tax=Phyllosticta capitalensis TaxID=121624 RepID=A0ABR1YTM6_9PEZI